MDMTFKLQVFEGPLDLLLYLIEKNKVNIYDIPIVEITAQYMEYVDRMKKDNLDTLSEFLVMAATLLDIKSKMLLPKKEEEEQEQDDPRAELVQQLLEYKMYKCMANELKDRQLDAGKVWYKKKDIPDEVLAYEEPVNLEELVGDIRLSDLNRIFQSIIKRQEEKIDKVRSKFGKIRENKETAWKVSDRAWKEKDQYKEILQAYDTILHDTDRANAPWIIVESMDRRFAVCKIMKELVDRMEMALLEKSQKVFKEAEEEADPMRNSILQGVDLTKSLTPEEYKSKKKKLQKKLAVLQNECYRLKVPVVLAFEGWDAGGKGGAIKRLTQAMDPRGYEVVPVSAPNDLEKSHHYLWRFWNKFPEDGKTTIFDRTWYGRVLVERIEGFAREDEWKRAYAEINHMERQLTEHGAVLLKFWMHIDKEEQAVRFEQRQEIPEKQWKITDEDWRNREKWDQYEVAVDEMIVRTSTEQAPWHIIEGNSKLYARIRVMEVVVEALEKKISLLQK